MGSVVRSRSPCRDRLPACDTTSWDATGNGNQGHTYGTALSPEEKEALLEYLKTQ